MNEQFNTYLTVSDVAKILKINNRSVMRLVKEGKLKALKPSEKRAYFTIQLIKEYLGDK